MLITLVLYKNQALWCWGGVQNHLVLLVNSNNGCFNTRFAATLDLTQQPWFAAVGHFDPPINII